MAAKKKKASAAKKKPAATRKKKPAAKKKKTAPRKKQAAAKKKKPAAKKKTAPKKKKATSRKPPMHAPRNHPELDDEPHGSEVFEIFRTYDSNNSGSIDRREFARLVEALGMAMSEEELQVALDEVDANHSGRISWSEFRAWWNDR